MEAAPDSFTSRFRLVEPMAGFGTTPVASPACGQAAADAVIWGSEQGERPETAEDCIAVAPRCTIRRGGDKPYLQCELAFPEAEGWMEVHEGERLVDRAELVRGWQHSAVSIADVAPEAELSLVFRDSAGAEVEGVHVRALFLSDDWGRGRRRRLKCDMPFRMAAIFADFSVSPCCARQWMNGDQSGGNTKTESLAEIWNGPRFRQMRADFLDHDYGRSCRVDICPVLRSEARAAEPPPNVIRAINEGQTILDFGPSSVHHDIDRGCNLECVMCRDSVILPDRANVDRAMADIKDALDLGSLEQISFSGAGEIFIMAKVVRLLESDAFSSRGVQVAINTNLTHFNEKLWRRIAHNDFSLVVVSADGCSSPVYESIRVGAKWAAVERNMRFLAQLRRDGAVRQIIWNYTVQRENVCDVQAAIHRARELGFDAIRFIAQLGEQGRTGGNMFEELDLDALDRLYDALTAEDGFADPHIITSELGIDGRRYRSFDNRLELARHLFGRNGYSAAGRIAAADWAKCVRLLDGIAADMGTAALQPPFHLSEQDRDFLARVARTALSPIELLRRLRHPVVWRGRHADLRAWRSARRLLRSARSAA